MKEMNFAEKFGEVHGGDSLWKKEQRLFWFV